MIDKTYILDNDMLERYILGDLTEDDNRLVETALVTYPELKAMLEALEVSFETLGFENAVDAPISVKAALLNSISNTAPKVVSIVPKKSLKPYLFTASGIAAVLVLGLMYVFSQLNTAKKQLQVVESKNVKLQKNITELSTVIEVNNKRYTEISNPDVEKYVLKGNTLMPEATVISYVNNSKKTVIVDTKHLPDLDEAHDYQMWADVEGEMINMGIIDNNIDMVAMTYIDHAASLNITIEPAGGNDHPTVSRLITNIYL